MDTVCLKCLSTVLIFNIIRSNRIRNMPPKPCKGVIAFISLILLRLLKK